MRWEAAAVLWDVTSRICSKDYIAFSYSFHLAFFSERLLRVYTLPPYSDADRDTAGKKSYFILTERPGFQMIDNLLIGVHALALPMLTSLSVDMMLLPRYVVAEKGENY